MAKRFVAFLFVFAGTFASAQEAEQPLKKAKLGDYVVFKMDNPQVKMSMRQEVAAVSDKEVTIRTTMTINGMAQPASEQKVDINQKYDPAAAAKAMKESKVVDTGKGEETLKIAGKDYKCEWLSNKVTVKAGDMDITTESKVWISKNAPLYGLVKTESKVFGQVTVMELVETGSRK